MRRRISERGHRIGGAYELTTFARVLPGRADELEAYLAALPRGLDGPFARIATLHIARVQLFRALVHQGPKQRRTDVLQNAHRILKQRTLETLESTLNPGGFLFLFGSEHIGQCLRRLGVNNPVPTTLLGKYCENFPWASWRSPWARRWRRIQRGARA